MKLQIDTEALTITIEENINLSELIDILNNMFPQESWKQYKLIPGKIINISYPVIYQQTPVTYPWWTPIYTPTLPNNYDVTCGTGSITNPLRTTTSFNSNDTKITNFTVTI